MRGKNKPEKKGRVTICLVQLFPGTGKNSFLIAHWGKSGEKITPEKNKNVKKSSRETKKKQAARSFHFTYKNDHFFELHN